MPASILNVNWQVISYVSKLVIFNVYLKRRFDWYHSIPFKAIMKKGSTSM